jgi:hypothetical protein
LITPLWAQFRNGKQMIDICIEASTVTGFVALVRHGEEGVLSQVFIFLKIQLFLK